MDKIAVLGDRESVLGFLALGLEVRPAETAQEGREALRELAQTCAVIFVTETLAQELAPEIIVVVAYGCIIPAILPIPGKAGPMGLGGDAVHRAVQRAVGSDIT